MNTLITFKQQAHWRALRGERGRGKNQTGAQGQDLVIPVPPGTVAYDADSGELLADLIQEGQRALLAAGGRGGRGNASFTTSTNQAPRIAENGEPGEERWIKLELKLIADVGFIGMPNAGKSTLLSVVSAARPKIADYPFTTLQPNLGVVAVGNQTFVAADIPGLIEGAHEGAGLGHEFLRHVERTRILVHLVDGTAVDIMGDFRQINNELAMFSQKLADKPQILVLNKMDIPAVREIWPLVRDEWQEAGHQPLAISAVTGENVDTLLYAIIDLLEQLPREVEGPELPVFEAKADEKRFEIEHRKDGSWRVRGVAIERAAVMTRWDLHESAMRFQRILGALGITEALEAAGVKHGDLVHFGDIELEWQW